MKEKSLLFFCFLLLAACNGGETIEKFPKLENKYDPSRPKEVSSMKPVDGRVDENFVLEGNFGTDISEMKVYFGDRKAVLLKTDGQTLHGIVPKQDAGDNPVSVVLGKDSIATGILFHYRQFQDVKTITGSWEKRQDWGGGSHVDGTLDVATYTFTVGLTVVAGGNLIVGESWFNRLRFVSIEDNEVVRISGDWGPAFTQGSPTSDGEAAYFVERGGNHYIHLLERANGWSPIRITKAGYPQFSGEIHSSAFRGDDRYLYMRDSHGNFGRVDLENTANDFPVEMLMINVNGNYSEGRTILCYSKFSDCFYVTSPADQGIYKIWEDTSSGEWKIERYAGFNGSGYAEGDRLADAKFNYPTGICADNMGNVYVTNESNGTIFKIWLKDGRVEHVAGKEHGWIERPVIVGKPLDSQFKDPSSIVMDQEENFFITSLNGHEIHKYSIE